MSLCTVGHDTLGWDDQRYLYGLVTFIAAVMAALSFQAGMELTRSVLYIVKAIRLSP